MNAIVSTDHGKCWKCHVPITRPIQLNNPFHALIHAPTPGSISICAGCGAFGVYDSLLKVQKPSPEMLSACESSEVLQKMREDLMNRPGM